MTRELKFRVWDEDKNKMRRPATIKEMIETQNLKIPEGEERFIMQYTGLLDKNGVEIYEDNVVEYHGKELDHVETPFVSKVSFVSGAFMVSVVDKNHPKTIEHSYGIGTLAREDLEVIGNVHEDKNLL